VIPEDKLTIPFYNSETGEQAGTATLEGEMRFSRIIQADGDRYLMVDEMNWEVARRNCPGCTQYRMLKDSSKGYPVIDLGMGVFAVPERFTEALCRCFPQIA
jgi:hypothetical protein